MWLPFTKFYTLPLFIYLFQYFVFKFDKRTNSCPPKYFEILNKTVNLPFDATMIFHM